MNTFGSPWDEIALLFIGFCLGVIFVGIWIIVIVIWLQARDKRADERWLKTRMKWDDDA